MNIEKAVKEIIYLAGDESALTEDLLWEDFDNSDTEDWVTLVDIVSNHVGNISDANETELQMMSLATGFSVVELESGFLDN